MVALRVLQGGQQPRRNKAAALRAFEQRGSQHNVMGLGQLLQVAAFQRFTLAGGQILQIRNLLQSLFQRCADDDSLGGHWDLAAGLFLFGLPSGVLLLYCPAFGGIVQAAQCLVLIAENRAVRDLVMVAGQGF